MSGNLLSKKFFLVVSFSLLFLLLRILGVQAQTASSPQFLITWHAEKSFTPSFYSGKSLPTITSPITASIELLAGGRTLDLSSQKIYWYLEGNLIGGGVGARHITFSPYANGATSLELKVQLPNYNGNFLIHAIAIPVVQPKTVIEALYPKNQFSDSTINLKALAYFFADPASSIVYSWTINGVLAQSAENPDMAQINIPAGTPPGSIITADLSVTDPNNYSTAQSTLRLTYSKQP